jgi:hypothetical protein
VSSLKHFHQKLLAKQEEHGTSLAHYILPRAPTQPLLSPHSALANPLGPDASLRSLQPCSFNSNSSKREPRAEYWLG